MPFEEGQSGNPAGRPKGAVNKASRELRGMISTFLVENFEEVQKCFNELTYKEKIRIYCDLLPFGVSRLRPTQDNALERLTDKELAELYIKLKIVAKETIKEKGSS